MSRPSSSLTALRSLGIPARPGSIYETALTHRSFASEQPGEVPDNERLEFLGDAVLDAFVSELIYTSYPEYGEGPMTELRKAIVSTTGLAAVARALGLGPLIRLGHGERESGGADKDTLLAGTFEALVGAVLIDRGAEEARSVVGELLTARIHQAAASGPAQDPKNELQELVVRTFGRRPEYDTRASGPEHDRTFTSEVYVAGEVAGAGRGRSKTEAEQQAARAALAGPPPTEHATEVRDARAG